MPPLRGFGTALLRRFLACWCATDPSRDLFYSGDADFQASTLTATIKSSSLILAARPSSGHGE